MYKFPDSCVNETAEKRGMNRMHGPIRQNAEVRQVELLNFHPRTQSHVAWMIGMDRDIAPRPTKWMGRVDRLLEGKGEARDNKKAHAYHV